MKRILLTYGLISGVFCSLLVSIALPFENKIGYDHSYYLGYTIIVLSFLLVFFGIRSYRNSEGNGHITFARAFGVGISITLVTCVFYVLTWEIIYFNFMHDFMDKYAAYAINKLRASGASAATIQAQIQQMAKLKQSYENPLYNSMITFLEPFPVGLAITVLSAAILRKKAQPQPAATPSPVSN